MVAFITNINPIITRNTILMEINDITSAPVGPAKLELIETTSDISITSIFTHTEKDSILHSVRQDRASKRIPFKITGQHSKPCISDQDGTVIRRVIRIAGSDVYSSFRTVLMQ